MLQSVQNISFHGLLKIYQNKLPKIINTDRIITAEGNAEDNNVEIKMSNNDIINLNCKFADIEKALIQANKDGFYNFMPSISAKEKYIPTKETDNVFELIPDNIAKAYKPNGNLCPNSLNTINSFLRRNEETTEKENAVINALDEAFNNICGLKDDKTFYRTIAGCDLEQNILDSKEGDVIIPDKGYAQAGINSNYISGYIPPEGLNPVVFEIRCKKGSKICKVPGRLTGSGYDEVMLPRDAKFKVLKKEERVKYTCYYPAYGGNTEKEDKIVTKFTLEYIEK